MSHSNKKPTAYTKSEEVPVFPWGVVHHLVARGQVVGVGGGGAGINNMFYCNVCNEQSGLIPQQDCVSLPMLVLQR